MNNLNKGRPSKYSILVPEKIVRESANVFGDEETTYRIWSLLYEKQKQGKEVFFTSQSFHYLKHIVDYDKLKLMEVPSEIYDEETYSNGDLGYQNRIYRIV